MTAAVTPGVQAQIGPSMVDRITAIVDVLDASTSLGLDSVAARARLPRSTTHRILEHLVRLDWAVHSGRGYRLGRRAMSWGDSADLRLRSAAAPVLSQLQDRTAAVVHLGVLDRGHVVYLDKLGATGLEVPTRVGSSMLAHRTSLGVAILGLLTPEQVLDHLHAADADESLSADLSLELHRIRRNGFAHRFGDYGSAFASLAAPINAHAALGIVMPATASFEQYKPLVRTAAARVRESLRRAAHR